MNKRTIIYLTATLLLAAGWYLLLERPTQHQVSLLESANATQRAELEALLAALAAVPEQLRTDRGFDSLRASLNDALVSTGEIETLFAGLEREAHEYRLQTVELMPDINELLALDTLRSVISPPVVSFTIRFAGSYLDFGRFVARLEQTRYFQGIRMISIQSTDDPEYPLLHSLNIRAILREPGEVS